MTLKETFPEFYSIFKLAHGMHPLWNVPTDWTNSNAVMAMDVLISEHVTNNFPRLSVDNILSETETMLDSLIREKLRLSEPNGIERLRFLQLTTGAAAASTFNRAGQFHLNFSIFFKSLYDRTYETGEVYELQPRLLWDFFFSKCHYIKDNILEISILWLGELYYYSRSFSGLNEWCMSHFPPSIQLVIRLKPQTISGIFLISQLYDWGLMNNQAEQCTTLLDYLRSLNAGLKWKPLSHELKKNVTLQLAVVTAIKKEERTYYIQELKSHASLDPSQLLHLYGNNVSNLKELIDYRPDIEKALAGFNASLRSSVTKLDASYVRLKHLKTINGLIVVCAKNGAGKELKNVFGGYYDTGAINGKVVFFLVNSETGLLYCFESSVKEKLHDVYARIPDLVNIRNRFLNITHMLRGGFEDPFLPTREAGIPDSVYGHQFENFLTGYFEFDLIKDKIDDVDLGFCLLGFGNLPLQPLMIKTIGKTIPNFLSIANKGSFRSLCRVLFWSGNSMTSDLETTCIRKIFSDTSVELVVVEQLEATKERFIHEYSSDVYDLIWVASHGQHDHYAPSASSISLSDNESITLPELYGIKPSLGHRRVVFLNICEGGTTTQIGEFKNVGFPEALAGANQDVISHLWMTRPLAALLFGVFFAIELVKEKVTPFQAYCGAIQHLLSGKEEVIKKLTTGPQDLDEVSEKVQHDTSVEWDNIVTWGSATYYT